MDKVLIVDTSTSFLNDVESLLSKRYTIVKATSGKQAIEVLGTEHVSVVLLGLELQDTHVIELLKRIREEIDPHLPVIILADYLEGETAIEAMHFGAYDCIPRNFNLNLLSAKITKALEQRNLEIRVRVLQSGLAEQHDHMVCVSDAMKKIHFEIVRLATLDFDVLITGETGVGKDLIAFEIHRRGDRHEKPFVSVALRTLNESLIESELFGHEKGAFTGAEKTKIGKLEAANAGTLYIPEISSLTEAVQLKLFEFMQYKRISRVGQDPRKPEIKLDVRLLMATNESLEELVKSGKIREDFYHRAAGVKLSVPPLRARAADIEPLANYFIKKFSPTTSSEKYQFSPEVISAFKAYRWPGNVRELENAIKNALAYSSGNVLTLNDFPQCAQTKTNLDQCHLCMVTRFQSFPGYKGAVRDFRRAYLEELLRQTGYSISRAAQLAGMTTQGLRKILDILHIRREEPPEG